MAQQIKDLEQELKKVRHRLFSAKTPATKRRLRDKDEEIRERIGKLLVEYGLGNKTAKQLAGWDPYDQNAFSPFFDPEWMFDISDGFDVVIGNPPYIGEKGNKNIFRELSVSNIGKRFYQRKMDIFYFFFHIAIDLLNEKGVFSYITTNYFPTADAAKNLRNDMKERICFIKLVNFNDVIIFESAKGQHNLISIGTKHKNNGYTETIICKGNVNISLQEVDRILFKNSSKAVYYRISHSDVFEGEKSFIRFEKDKITEILNKIENQSVLLKTHFFVNQGILSGADKVTQKHINENRTKTDNKGKGVFVLSQNDLNEISLNKNERHLIKKFFKNSDVDKYIANDENKFFLLYLTRAINIDNYPNIKKHIEKYKPIINARSKDRGEIQAALKLGKWWVIFAARDKNIFEGEKIISPQRSKSNTFAYNNTEWFSSADVYYITKKESSSLSLKYILALLNSTVYFHWLYKKGKRKGEMLELYATPLENIPIKEMTKKQQLPFELIVDQIIFLKKNNWEIESKVFENIVDGLVFNIYFPDHMKERKIDILQFVEKDLKEVMQGREFGRLIDNQKKKVINQLHARWTDPKSQIVKRMNSFAKKSPDILKPILESR